jgi:hypothetical protein
VALTTNQINNTTMIHNGTEYFTFEELKPIAQTELRHKLLNSEHKFLGNIEKTYNNKVDIGRWILHNGYTKIRLQINGARSIYYYKA